jgi:hypothetical protein
MVRRSRGLGGGLLLGFSDLFRPFNSGAHRHTTFDILCLETPCRRAVSAAPNLRTRPMTRRCVSVGWRSTLRPRFLLGSPNFRTQWRRAAAVQECCLAISASVRLVKRYAFKPFLMVSHRDGRVMMRSMFFWTAGLRSEFRLARGAACRKVKLSSMAPRWCCGQTVERVELGGSGECVP